MRNKVLMIDARQIFNKVTRKIYDFTPEQQKNISSIVWLYRGQTDRFIELIAEHLTNSISVAEEMPLPNFIESAETVLKIVFAYSSYGDQDSLDALKIVLNNLSEILKNIIEGAQKLSTTKELSDLKLTESAMVEMSEMAKNAIKKIDIFHKQAFDLISSESGNRNKNDRKTLKILDNASEQLKNSLKSFRNMHAYAHWLLNNFPDAKLVDIEGLIKLVDHEELESNDWSLTPGRYVGVPRDVEDENFDFEEAMTTIHDELELLNAEAEELASLINKNFSELIS